MLCFVYIFHLRTYVCQWLSFYLFGLIELEFQEVYMFYNDLFFFTVTPGGEKKVRSVLQLLTYECWQRVPIKSHQQCMEAIE